MSIGLQCSMPKGISVPKAYMYRTRGERVEKGMFVAVHCSASGDEKMAGQPFWIARVKRVSKRHVTLHYYGPKFLGLYVALCEDEVLTYRRDAITFLHWNIKLVGHRRDGGGRLSAGDQSVLSLDDRVPWRLDKHSATIMGRSKKRKATAQSKSKRTAKAAKKRKK